MGDALYDSVARFYDAEIEELLKSTNDVSFYREYAGQCGGEVLELACGTGRVLVPLAQQGIKITGLDASPKMLDEARKRIKILPHAVQQYIQLEQHDMMSFTLDRIFSMIFCTFRSFQHLTTKEEQGACLMRVREHLVDKGMFILHLFVPYHHLLAQKHRTIYLGTFKESCTGAIVSRRSEVTYDLAAQILHEDRFYEWTDEDGKFHQHVWSFDFAFLFHNEALLMLEKYGFETVDVFGDFSKSPYNYHSGEQIFVTKKMPAQGWS
jgi:SAM-dependent methyltransferase